jgi:hypothetical protein
MNREPDCAWGLLLMGLIACTLALWTIISHPTPAERARAWDSTGKTTGVNWR